MFSLTHSTELRQLTGRQVWPGGPQQWCSAVPPRLTFSPLFRGLDFTKPSLDREIGSRIWPGLKAAYRVIPTPM